LNRKSGELLEPFTLSGLLRFLFMPILNAYDLYIQRLQDRYQNYVSSGQFPSYLEKHRIVPGHQGGTYVSENTVRCTLLEHKVTHLVRWLVFKQLEDEIAFRLMRKQTEKGRRLLAKLAGLKGGPESAKKARELGTRFFDPEWQAKYGSRDGGKRNLESGWIHRLNGGRTEKNSQQRSEAGKLGAQVVIDRQRREKTHLFDPKAKIQRRGNLVRWGVIIDGTRIPFERLSETFVDYFLHFGWQKATKNSRMSMAISSEAEGGEKSFGTFRD
jgi:hypothetical protein